MLRTKTIQIRVTPEEHERIRNKALAKGHATISAFMLHCTLEKDLLFERHFEEMYRAIMKKCKKSGFDEKTDAL
ncbi:MAG: hypothetical protein HY363_04965 [Candidatus Aenigmarchaeota archaeon]|nr:hypothetical protein [Candidatus Aenigmarchaeota archaeon]